MRLGHTEQFSDLPRSHAGILWSQDLKNQVHLAPETGLVTGLLLLSCVGILTILNSLHLAWDKNIKIVQ